MTNPNPIEHDFEKCLEDALNENIPYSDWFIIHDETIQAALKLAIRLQNGDVSEGMYSAGLNCGIYDGDLMIGHGEPEETFKAMSQKMLEEINDVKD